MRDLLAVINSELEKAGIPYQLSEWKSAVRYPYFVGSYDESSFTFENGKTEGTFIIDGWSRHGLCKLLENVETIKRIFSDFRYLGGGAVYRIMYHGCMTVPTGVEDLDKVTITLYITEWKGD